jgi:hypothetical protein
VAANRRFGDRDRLAVNRSSLIELGAAELAKQIDWP